MSKIELENIRRRKIRELRMKLALKEEKKQSINKDKILDRIFRGRAWEVFNAANSQFPEIMINVKDAFIKLILSGRIKEITGEQLYLVLRNFGLKVRLNTKIRYTEHGKFQSLAEKIKEDLRKN